MENLKRWGMKVVEEAAVVERKDSFVVSFELSRLLDLIGAIYEVSEEHLRGIQIFFDEKTLDNMSMREVYDMIMALSTSNALEMEVWRVNWLRFASGIFYYTLALDEVRMDCSRLRESYIELVHMAMDLDSRGECREVFIELICDFVALVNVKVMKRGSLAVINQVVESMCDYRGYFATEFGGVLPVILDGIVATLTDGGRVVFQTSLLYLLSRLLAIGTRGEKYVNFKFPTIRSEIFLIILSKKLHHYERTFLELLDLKDECEFARDLVRWMCMDGLEVLEVADYGMGGREGESGEWRLDEFAMSYEVVDLRECSFGVLLDVMRGEGAGLFDVFRVLRVLVFAMEGGRDLYIEELARCVKTWWSSARVAEVILQFFEGSNDFAFSCVDGSGSHLVGTLGVFRRIFLGSLPCDAIRGDIFGRIVRCWSRMTSLPAEFSDFKDTKVFDGELWNRLEGVFPTYRRYVEEMFKLMNWVVERAPSADELTREAPIILFPSGTTPPTQYPDWVDDLLANTIVNLISSPWVAADSESGAVGHLMSSLIDGALFGGDLLFARFKSLIKRFGNSKLDLYVRHVSSLYICSRVVGSGHLDEYSMALVISVLKDSFSDYQPDVKILGAEFIVKMSALEPSFARRLDESILKSCIVPSLGFREPMLISSLFSAARLIIETRDLEEMPALADALVGGILYELDFLQRNDLILLHLRFLNDTNILKLLHERILIHLAPLLARILTFLDFGSFELIVESLKVLRALILCAWIRIDHRCELIVGALSALWIRLIWIPSPCDSDDFDRSPTDVAHIASIKTLIKSNIEIVAQLASPKKLEHILSQLVPHSQQPPIQEIINSLTIEYS